MARGTASVVPIASIPPSECCRRYGVVCGGPSPTRGHLVTERKPPGLSWESWTEKQIEEGRRAGLFDGLEGQGKPIDGLDGSRDEDWWVKAKLRREEIDYLPPTIAIRRERDAAVAAALEATDEAAARRLIEQINEQIRYVNSHTVAGPPSTVWVVDVEPILERWRAAHPFEPDVADGPAIDVADPETGPQPARRRWFGVRRRSAS
jgi:hypothetical protein